MGNLSEVKQLEFTEFHFTLLFGDEDKRLNHRRIHLHGINQDSLWAFNPESLCEYE